MRVHEFAKKHNKTSKEVLELLTKEKCELKSHISVIPEEIVKALEQRLSLSVDQNKKGAKVVSVQVESNAAVINNNNASAKEEETVNHPVQNRPKTSTSPVPPKKDKPAQPFSKGRRNNKNSKPAFNQRPFVQQQEKKAPEVFDIKPILLVPTTVADFCIHTYKQPSEVIITLLKEGQVCTKNHLLTVEQVQKLAKIYGLETVAPVIKKTATDVFQKLNADASVGLNTSPRLPVVVVMGHVDHGKTSLLDYIRKTRVASREKGGITQHLGAYEAHTARGNIIFLDTPGHEAFSKIRQRGASVADIAILVVAADDGVMPQTIESIRALQSLNIPIIVAMNKMDKADEARVEIIKRQLSQYGILPEEWGGQVVCCPISAKTGQGIDSLLEMILLQAEMLELKTITTVPAQGYVLESKVERGRGAVATVLCRQGILKIGDFFHTGNVWGKVSSLVDSYGAPLKEVGASMPVVVSGFDDFPSVGELFRVVTEEEYRRDKGVKARAENHRAALLGVNKETIAIVLKADTNSSLEAVVDGIDKISKTSDKVYYIVHSAVGPVTENDAILCQTAGALLIGFHTKVETAATQYARQSSVKILSFDIIYKLFEDLEVRSKKDKVIEKKETKIGEALILKVFDIKNLGVIAGAYVREGRFSEQGTVIVKRGKKQVGQGKIKSLQRDKKSVKEVHTGYECAFIVDGFNEWEIDDMVECYLKI